MVASDPGIGETGDTGEKCGEIIRSTREIGPSPNASQGVSPSAGSSQWIEQVYDDLHRMAESLMKSEQNTVSLSPTVLIHELYLRLSGDQHRELNRSHFFALAAGTMRRVLVDQARFRKRKKRGSGGTRRPLEDWDSIGIDDCDQIIAVDEALDALERLDSRQSKVVELRFFGGLTVAEVAEQLQISKRTVEAEWTMAKAWLRRWLDSQEDSA